MIVTDYTIKTNKNVPPLTIALVCDLHHRPYNECLRACLAANPDVIMISGDLMSSLSSKRPETLEKNRRGYDFLRAAAKERPTFYSLGNHEGRADDENIKKIAETGAVLLDDSFTEYGGYLIGGLSSGFKRPKTFSVDEEFLHRFASLDGYKILLCHHPEYYPKFIKELDVDLTLSGHAHGGQWRFFGRGIYAPGQGIFPKYTSGVYDGRLVVSRGLANCEKIPRIFNPTEVVTVKIVPTKETRR